MSTNAAESGAIMSEDDGLIPPVRPRIARMTGYVPGEQPQSSGWIKLNTNENPYPPSPRVVQAIQAAAAGRLNVYPDPLATRVRQAIAHLYELDPDWILPANGSDENLTILMRTFVDPGESIASPYPSYILYETLAEIQGARFVRLSLRNDWSFDLPQAKQDSAECRLVFVPNPNSPSGNRWDDPTLLNLIPNSGVLVLDEAYGDFVDHPHQMELLKSHPQKLVVTRTLSKSYSLAGIRFGFAMAHPDLISEMRKVKDSYNCNALSLAAATAAIEDQDWMKENCARIRVTRRRLSDELTSLGFSVVPSQANFVWVTHPSGQHKMIYESLKHRKILVRYIAFPDILNSSDGVPCDGLRITIGTDHEIDQLLEAIENIMNHMS